MAIKERKQITGTTAQINAYEGHEGQIVWDKEKKTLVGMSGTAGKNYPLAPKEYVDNEVAKVNTELQETNAEVAKKQPKGDYATNAQLTAGLAGKEDKGVCLPLSGGTLTGPIFMAEDNRINASTPENFKGLEIVSGKAWTDGAGLFLRSNSATGEGEAGQWGLAAHHASPSAESLLIGRVGHLLFDGAEVERSNEIFGSVIEGGFYDVYRYATGLQIIIAGVTIPINQIGLTFTFPRPFINQSYSIAANAFTALGDVAITWESGTTTSVNLYRQSYRGVYDFATYVKCAFIGKWK